MDGRSDVMKPSRSSVDLPRWGWSSRMELGALIVVAGVSVILAGACFALSGRLGAVERAVAASRSDSARQNELSRRLEVLSGRVEGSEKRLRSERASAARLEGALSGLSSEVDSLKRSLEAGPSAAQVNELFATVRGLSGELAQVKRLAEAAAQNPRAAPSSDGASARDLAALRSRLAAFDARLAELGRKASSRETPQVRVNEEALRKVINQMVQAEMKKALESRRDAWRRRRQEQQ